MNKKGIVILPSLKNKLFYRRNFIITILLLIIFISVIWISLLQFRSPEVLPRNAKDNQFSAQRAEDYLKEFAIKPHPIGSKEHDRVRDYLMNTLTSLGVTPKIQKVENVNVGKNKVDIENIIARIPGKESSKAIMITAHYDTVSDSPGGADDGSSVASILETVRILLKSQPLKNDVIILITDGEEEGSLGAQAFVKNHPWAKDVGLVLNFEARGSTGPSVLFETSEGNDMLVSEFNKGTPHPVGNSFLYNLYKIMPNDTDLTTFKQSGMNGMNFAFFEGLSNYHTANDNLANLSLGSLQHQGENMLYLTQQFGNLNLVNKNEGNKLFFNFLGKYIVSYSEKFVIPIMILSIISFVFSFAHGYKHNKTSLLSSFYGFLISILTMGLAFVVGRGLWYLVKSSNNSWRIVTNIRISNIFFICFILLLFLLIAIIYQISFKKISAINLTMGAFFSWLVLLIVTSIFLKGSSYVFAWPLLLGLIGVNILMRLQNEHNLKGYIINIGIAVPAIFLTSPVIYLIYVLLSLKSISIILPLISLLGAFLIPIFNMIRVRDKFIKHATLQKRMNYN
jgi:hypothetical protein